RRGPAAHFAKAYCASLPPGDNDGIDEPPPVYADAGRQCKNCRSCGFGGPCAGWCSSGKAGCAESGIMGEIRAAWPGHAAYPTAGGEVRTQLFAGPDRTVADPGCLMHVARGWFDP